MSESAIFVTSPKLKESLSADCSRKTNKVLRIL